MGPIVVGAAGGGSIIATNGMGVHGATPALSLLTGLSMLITAVLQIHRAWHERVMAREGSAHERAQSLLAAEKGLALEELKLRREADRKWLESQLELALAEVDRDRLINLAELERQSRGDQLELFRLAVDAAPGRAVESLRVTPQEISAVMPATQRSPGSRRSGGPAPRQD